MDGTEEAGRGGAPGTGEAVSAALAEEWAQVEVFGHRKHFGRITEVERFGARMLRVDAPLYRRIRPDRSGRDTIEEAGEATFFYGGGSIFSVTPMSEEAARAWARESAPYAPAPITALPSPRDGFATREEILGEADEGRGDTFHDDQDGERA